MWCIAVVLAFAAGFVMWGSLGGYKLRPQDAWVQPASFVVSGVVFWMAFRMPHWHPFTRTTIDRRQRLVTVERNSLYGRARDRHPFDEVREFHLAGDTDDDGQMVWFPELVLRRSQSVPLATSRFPNRAKCLGIVAEANWFLSGGRPNLMRQ